jgi:hypothetical protein
LSSAWLLSTPRLLGTAFDRLELRDRFARAVDLMADLDARERQVVAVMGSYGVGPVPAAHYLGLPLGEVRSAARSANAKLDRVAVIAAAGRMCEFRYKAIAAEAAGEASENDARLARAHVSACVPCERNPRALSSREGRGAFATVPGARSISAGTSASQPASSLLLMQDTWGEYWVTFDVLEIEAAQLEEATGVSQSAHGVECDDQVADLAGELLDRAPLRTGPQDEHQDLALEVLGLRRLR